MITCCGVEATEIKEPGKPVLFICPKCGRKRENLLPGFFVEIKYFNELEKAILGAKITAQALKDLKIWRNK